jgi:hypothetical protein
VAVLFFSMIENVVSAVQTANTADSSTTGLTRSSAIITIQNSVNPTSLNSETLSTWNKIYYGGANAVCIRTRDGGYAITGSQFPQLIKTDASGNVQWIKDYETSLFSDSPSALYLDATSIVQTSDDGYALTVNSIAGSVGNWTFKAVLVKVDSQGKIQWSKTYVDNAWSASIVSVVQTPDGGYLMIINNELVKVDSTGNIEWKKTYELYSFSLIVKNSDGGYVLAGSSYSDFLLAKVGSSGNLQWYKTYDDGKTERLYSVVQTEDGGYVLAGSTGIANGTTALGSADFWLVKTDSEGNTLWNKSYGGPLSDEAYSVIQTSDGGYALAGFTGSTYTAAVDGVFDHDGSGDFWLVKTDSEGNTLWNKSYGGLESDYVCSVFQTGDGNYVLAGVGFGWGTYVLLKTDSEGNGVFPSNDVFTTPNPQGASFSPSPSIESPFVLSSSLNLGIRFLVIGVSFLMVQLVFRRSRKPPND